MQLYFLFIRILQLEHTGDRGIVIIIIIIFLFLFRGEQFAEAYTI